MKLIIALALVVIAAAKPAEEFYSSRYDDFDVDALIGNDRLMKSYNMCFLGIGKCTPEGSDFSKLIPEAVQSTCAKCTDKQKVLIAKVMKAISEKHTDDWEKLREKFDPEHKRDEDIKGFIKQYSA